MTNQQGAPEALYAAAMEFAAEKASISYVQRKCRCSWNDAEQMLERMVREGIIATYGGRKSAALVEAQQPAPSAAAAVVVYEQKENEMQVWFRPARMHGHPERTPIKATITKDRGNGIVDLTYDDGEFSGNARAVPNALRLQRNVREQVAVWWDVGFEMDFQTAVDNSLKKKKDDPPPQPSPTPQADPLQPVVSLQEQAGMYADDFAPQADSQPAPATRPASLGADERAAFEVYAGDQGYPLKRLEIGGGLDYIDLRTQGAWDSWQARAAHSQPAPLGAMRESTAAWVRWLRDPNRSYNPNAHELLANLLEGIVASPQPAPLEAPIDMVLYCPKCGLQHIDAPDERTPDWKNEPHRSHLCHGCGHIWRPADVPTNGVAAVKTTGKADSPISARAPADSVPKAQFDDPKVQAVYAILCDDAEPPKGEHWEGFAARRIVDALSADSVLEDAARMDWLDQQREAYGFQDIHEGNRWEISGPYANVREAIDADRAARKQGGA